MCGLWKVQLLDFNPEVACPTLHGWQKVDGELQATMTDELPAPEYSLEMSSCGCKKTRCVTGRCQCSSNGLTCTDLCKCLDCNNNNESTHFDTVDDEVQSGSESNHDSDNDE